MTPLLGGHLGGLVVGAIALADTALGSLAVFGVGCEPVAELPRVALDALDTLPGLGIETGFGVLTSTQN